MNDAELSRLRGEIDAIDDVLHDAIMRRTSLADQVRLAKGGGAPTFRPAREIQILRRLAERHEGRFPKAVLVRIWREIISATLGLQGPFSVAAHAPENVSDCSDLAREHFGYATSIDGQQSTRAVVHAVNEGSATVGVLPVPEENERDPWWPALLAYPRPGPTIVARLPVAPVGETHGRMPDALVIANIAHEETGHDRSYLMIRASSGVSRARLSAALGQVDMKAVSMITRPDDGDPDLTQFMFELDGFVADSDTRLVTLMESEELPIEAAEVLGGYAVPFSASDLASTKTGPKSGQRGDGQ
jgi:chorismate mutase / prephenate dehydratase